MGKLMRSRVVIFLTALIVGGLGTYSFCAISKISPYSFYKNGFSDIASQVNDSVVNIATVSLLPDEGGMANRTENLFFDSKKDVFGTALINPPKRVGSFGSGFVIKKEANYYYIATNAHNVEDAVQVKVVLSDETIIEAEVVGKDFNTDIAVLKIETDKNIMPLKWADSTKLRLGEWVMALGNPHGFGGTLTTGVVSYVARDLATPKIRVSKQNVHVEGFIQTEAAINPGNSGGPLINVKGEVVGVNTSTILTPLGKAESMGFAVPSKIAKRVTDSIIEHRKVRRSWIGVQIQTISKEIAKYYNLEKAEGAIVTGVTIDGPAMDAGLLIGDIILKVDNKDIKGFNDLPRIVANIKIGKEIVIKILRNGEEKELKTTVQEYKSHEDFKEVRKLKLESEDVIYNKKLEFGYTNLTPQFRQRFEVTDLKIVGVLIADVKEAGLASKFTLMDGDVIMEVNTKPVTEMKELDTELTKALKENPEKPILLRLYREGHQVFIAIDPNLKDKQEE
jgi:serine protease Do